VHSGSADVLPVVICGAAGRMGRRLVALAHEDPALRVAAAVESAGTAAIGQDAGDLAGVGAIGVAVEADLAATCRPEHVVIDFTVPAATVRHARIAADCGAGLVVGTTGLSAEQDAELRGHAARTRAVLAANYSVGITVLAELVSRAATLLDETFDAEIVEIHHHHKQDAPSGTALALGRVLAAARGRRFDDDRVLAREGLVGARRAGEIGIMGLRAGDVVGDHTVIFGGLGERLELTHRAQSRDCLVRGALRAAHWVAGRAPGIYGMRDVLGL
jgi:4-hydroxy-tetrahydrodipicolinate reductase